MDRQTTDADWHFIETLLPAGWRELATEMRLIPKLSPHLGQKIHDIGTVLRLVLHYVSRGGSMRATTAAASAAGIVSISQPALFKWMLKIGDYLENLVAKMVEPGRFDAEAWGGYTLIAADATTVSRPGAKGTSARLHYALHLSDLRPRFVRITDDHGGETARHFDVAPNELWIVDRGYSNPPSVLAVVRALGAILVRYNRHSLPVFDASGARIDVPSLLLATTRRGRAEHKAVRVIATDGGEARARLCWMRLPKPRADAARARAEREGEREPAELDLAEYVVVLT